MGTSAKILVVLLFVGGAATIKIAQPTWTGAIVTRSYLVYDMGDTLQWYCVEAEHPVTYVPLDVPMDEPAVVAFREPECKGAPSQGAARVETWIPAVPIFQQEEE